MPKYQVPQFIDTDTKAIGPLTLKQFLWVAIWFVVVLITGYTASVIVTFIVAIFLGAICGSLAFLKIQGMPFGRYLMTAFYYLISNKMYVFKHDEPDQADNVDKYLELTRKDG